MGGSESKGREGDGEAKESSGTALAVGAIAGAAILALGAVSMMGGSSKPSKGKTMKAPGRVDERIPRAPFEEDPADYFRNLRSDQRKQ
ncbi:uncharacterized protein J3R85_001594 [Psidium guajava]|nr:uncharacterized protein J3R85_001594 [Psidium guajava]